MERIPDKSGVFLLKDLTLRYENYKKIPSTGNKELDPMNKILY